LARRRTLFLFARQKKKPRLRQTAEMGLFCRLDGALTDKQPFDLFKARGVTGVEAGAHEKPL
jgi:hypothetical protein